MYMDKRAMFNIPRNRFFLRLPDPSSSQALSAPDALSVLMLSYPLLCPTESSEILQRSFKENPNKKYSRQGLIQSDRIYINL